VPDPVDILVVDDEDLICFVLTQLLKVHGYHVRTASRGEEALEMMADQTPALVILDIRMPGLSGFDVLHRARSAYPHIPVILMTALSGVRDAVEAMKSGAFDYVAKPFDNKEMIATVERALAQGVPSSDGPDAAATAAPVERIDSCFNVLGPGEAAQRMARQAQRLARGGKPCLITGEIGAGKQLLARLMHGVSGRPGDLIELHCTGAAESVLRHELYGGGSATGPATRGKLQMSRGGTLFVSGTDEMGASLRQTIANDFLRGYFNHPSTGAAVTLTGSLILSSVSPSSETRNTDDSGKDETADTVPAELKELIGERIIHIPPLRERREDIPYLVGLFMEEAAEEFDRKNTAIDDAALELLVDYDWPGNVHQLKALVRRTMLNAKDRIAVRDIDLPVPGYDRLSPLPAEFKVTAGPLKEQVRRYVGQIERDVLLQTLQYTSWNKSRASRLLGITYKTMLKKISDYGLDQVREWG